MINILIVYIETDEAWLQYKGIWHKLNKNENGSWNKMMSKVKKADEMITAIREAGHDITDVVVDHNVSDDED